MLHKVCERVVPVVVMEESCAAGQSPSHVGKGGQLAVSNRVCCHTVRHVESVDKLQKHGAECRACRAAVH
jgi:hypothetical protein